MSVAQSVVPDSLRKLLANAAGTRQVDLLNEITDDLLDRVPDSAYMYAGKAHNFAYILNYKPGMAHSRRSLGFLLLYQGKIDESVEQFREAIILYRDLKSPADEAICYQGLGDVAVTLSRFKDAEPYYQRALSIADSLKDNILKGKFLIPLATCYQAKGDPYKARETFLAALKLLEGTDNDRTLATLYTNLGSTYINTPDNEAEYKRGIGFLLKSIQIRRLIGDKLGLAHSSNILAFLYASRKDYTKAFEHMNESMAAWTEVDNKEKIAYTHYCLADLYLHIGEIDSCKTFAISIAREHLEQAQSMARQGSFRLIEINCLDLQCQLQVYGGEFVLAEQGYEQVLSMMLAVKDTLNHRRATLELAQVRDTIGDLYLMGGAYADAVPYYLKAAETMEKFSAVRPELLTTYANLVECASKSGQSDIAKQYKLRRKQLSLTLAAERKQQARDDKFARAQAREAAEASARAQEERARQQQREDEDEEEE